LNGLEKDSFLSVEFVSCFGITVEYLKQTVTPIWRLEISTSIKNYYLDWRATVARSNLHFLL